MSTRPTPGGDVDVWGGLVNDALDEIEAKADGAQQLAAAAHVNALQAKDINAGVAKQARDAAAQAAGHASAAEGERGRAASARVRAEAAAAEAWRLVQEAQVGSVDTEQIAAAENSDHTLDLYAVGTVLDVTVNGPCRVRAYRSSAERTADADRPFSTPYTAENGLLYDYLFTEASTDLGRPWYYAGDVFVRVDGGPVDITFRYVTTGVE